MSLHPITYAKIDLGALVHNYHAIKTATQTPVLCIVKADGYGHGVERCVKALYDAGARHFGVANPIEALQVRAVLPEADVMILILGYSDPVDAPILIDNRITQTLFSVDYAEKLLAHIPAGASLACHVKLDTGMNRLGFSSAQEDISATIDAIKALKAEARLDLCGIFTHFACADEPENPMTNVQIERFQALLDAFHAENIDFDTIHAANSAAIAAFPSAHHSLVRAGIILYGVMPSDDITMPDLSPVMSLHTHVTHVHQVKAGQTIGYGATFQAPRDMTIATLAIGYADGLIRAYKDAKVEINGHFCPILGRICMDQCMVDVSNCPVSPGDLATFFDQNHPVTTLSAAADMIPYETLCLIGKRVPRIYE